MYQLTIILKGSGHAIVMRGEEFTAEYVDKLIDEAYAAGAELVIDTKSDSGMPVHASIVLEEIAGIVIVQVGTLAQAKLQIATAPGGGPRH